MSNTVFNARFTPTASTTLSSTTFEVVADIFDGTGVYSGLDVSLNDIVFLDTFNSITAPSSVSRYKINSIVSKTLSSVDLVLEYEDSGDPVDPGEILGNPGFICLASSNYALAYAGAPTLHSFPDYITQYARNYDMTVKVDAITSASAVVGLLANYLNDSGSTLSALTVVSQDGSGNIINIDPTDETNVSGRLGILTQNTSTSTSGDVLLAGELQNITTALDLGAIVWLARDGSLTDTVPDIGVGSYQPGDFVIKIGKITKNASNPSFKDMKLELEVIGQL